MKKKLNNDEINNIITLYSSGISATKISKMYKVSVATICAYLHDAGIKVVNQQNIGKLSIFDKIQILGHYMINEISLSKISKSIKVNLTTICKFVHSQDIVIINRQNEDKFDSSIFDNIDTEEKAYWLGFIFADGYVSSRDNEFGITLKRSDYDHLVKFNKFVKHRKLNIKSKTIKLNGKIFNACVWSVVNKHLKNTLVSLGCVERKSCILKFPTSIIPTNLYKDFIRGYFDGDGCITYIKDNTKVFPHVSILGTKEFLETTKNILVEYGIEASIVSDKRMKSTYILNIKRKYINKFLDLLYDNSIIYLNRKYKRYIFFKSSVCRSVEELTEFLAGEIGEACDGNTEVT